MYTVTLQNDETIIINENSTTSKNRITGQIKKEVNATDSFTFNIYPNNDGYSKLTHMKSRINVSTETDENVFNGRVLFCKKSMDNTGICCINVTCESELGYLQDSIMMYGNLKQVGISTFLQVLIGRHNSQVTADKQFELGTVFDDATKTYDFTFDYSTALETINNQLINNENIGGEIRVRYANNKRYLDYTTTTFGTTSTTPIELAVNMISSAQQIDPSALITRLIPLGAKAENSADRLTIATVNSNKPYIDDTALIGTYGAIAGTVIFDEITSASQLKIKGQNWLKNQKPVKKSYEVSAVDLSLIDKNFDSFEIGKLYHIINPLINLDDTIRCLSCTIDISNPTATSLTFGDKFDTLTSITTKKTAQLQKQINNVTTNQTSLIKSIVDQQTSLITGVTDSYYYIDTTEGKERMCFMDSPDKDTAVNVLQINKNGIGFSHNGINGQYTSAWTIDGTFNTEFILAQELVGVKINNGNGTFKVDENGTVVANNLTSNTLIMMNDGLITLLSDDMHGGNHNSTNITPEHIQLGHEGTPVATINNVTGRIDSIGQIWCDDIMIKPSDDASGYVSLRTYMSNHP